MRRLLPLPCSAVRGIDVAKLSDVRVSSFFRFDKRSV